MIKKLVGNRIKQLRESKKLTQEDFAFQCGLDRTYISSLEHGKRNISIVNINRICKVFNIKLKDFFDFDKGI